MVVPQVGLGIIVGQAEGDQQGFPQGVGPARGVLEGVIVLRPLRLLHLVEDVVVAPHRLVVQVLNSLGLDTALLVGHTLW